MPDTAAESLTSATSCASPTVRQTLTDAVGRLRAAGIDGARLDAELLLANAMCEARSTLFTHDAAYLPREARKRFHGYLARRLAREPVSRILGRREFWSLELEISPAVLDPRPESEMLVETVLAAVTANDIELTIADLGTGSGCLLLALLSELRGAFAIGVDCDVAALEVARRNAVRTGLGDRAAFIAGDWATALAGCFDIIVCNPPYLASRETGTSPPELRYDPYLALDGGDDGLDAYRALVAELRSRLADGGRVFLEIGAAQAASVSEIVRSAGLEVEAIAPDLAGYDRCLVARVGGNLTAAAK